MASMKNPFKRYVIAFTGDFGEPRNHRSLERWIAGSGGIFSATVTADVTHLICTWDDWTKRVLKGGLMGPPAFLWIHVVATHLSLARAGTSEPGKSSPSREHCVELSPSTNVPAGSDMGCGRG